MSTEHQRGRPTLPRRPLKNSSILYLCSLLVLVAGCKAGPGSSPLATLESYFEALEDHNWGAVLKLLESGAIPRRREQAFKNRLEKMWGDTKKIKYRIKSRSVSLKVATLLVEMDVTAMLGYKKRVYKVQDTYRFIRHDDGWHIELPGMGGMITFAP